ncbi:tyrosine-type recombinase/integrase [Demequina phytophila]|uniref:tyrosine-type recombinase/integrase n=1 Tax=Demequina phytophila TaxID=1638981 RepID=UPI0007861537|nr:site-specific integrase [Demequina phytophila]
MAKTKIKNGPKQAKPANAKRNYKEGRRKWGSIRTLPSGNFRAEYTGPDLRRHKAPHTFQWESSAQQWLKSERKLIEKGKWTAPDQRKVATQLTLREFGDDWLAADGREESTIDLYSTLLDKHVYPMLGARTLKSLGYVDVEAWHEWARKSVSRRPREQAYSVLRAMLNKAVKRGLIKRNPCTLENVIQSKADKPGLILTIEQLADVAEAMGSACDVARVRADTRAAVAAARAAGGSEKEARAARYRATQPALVAHGIGRPEWIALIALGCYCALRTAELQALRRSDLDLEHGVLRVNVAARFKRANKKAGTKGHWTDPGDPKAASFREVTIPPHILPLLHDHVELFVKPESDALVFQAQRAKHLSSTTFFHAWKAALKRAGAPDIPFHNLRHTGASLASQSGATLAEVMHRLGHRTPRTALIYQHSTMARQRDIAAEMSRRALDEDGAAA